MIAFFSSKFCFAPGIRTKVRLGRLRKTLQYYFLVLGLRYVRRYEYVLVLRYRYLYSVHYIIPTVEVLKHRFQQLLKELCSDFNL